jgi:cobalt-zinc-cadmium efflux system outer membrane protein
MRLRSWIAIPAGVLIWPAIASAQPQRLTLSEALAHAREQAPRIVAARLTVDEARGRLLGAGLRFQNNPELDVGIGRRAGSGETSMDLDAGIQQLFEPRGRRTARNVAATEGVAQGTAAVDETTRLVLRETASAFLRALHAREQVKLLDAAEGLAGQVYAAADRRFKARDIAVLDVNLARALLARTRAEKQSAAAAESTAIGELKQLLGIDGDVAPEGTLAAREEGNTTALLEAANQRPELRQLEAAVREAEAETRVAVTYRKPDVGLAARYQREEGDNILFGGVTISLPTFARGQELAAVSSARAIRLRRELDAARTRVRIEVQAAFAALQQRAAAVRALETDALPGLDENERLTTRSFEVGQLGLTELLLIRREILDTRFQYLDTLLEAALAQIDLHASAAVLR